MGQAILFIGFGQPHPGTAEKAYGFISGEGAAFLKKYEGQYFERMDLFALTAHGGSFPSSIVLHGDRAKLDELRRTDEFEAFSMQMNQMFIGFGVVPGLNFEGVQAAMKRMLKNKT